MIGRFLKYVEISTKLASLFPFLLGIAYAYTRYSELNVANTALFFAAMIIFDMGTTALNNFIDTRTNGQSLGFSRRTALVILLVLLSIATLLGIFLALRTDLVILLAGAACFAVGILYTFGPAPISRMPLGEIFSGLFMGFFIPFLAVQINAPAGAMANVTLDSHMFTLALRWPELIKLFVLTLTPIATIANIMLANNICDVEHDRLVNRFTLPAYIGLRAAINIFALLYYAALASWIALVALGMVTPWSLVALLVAVPVEKNIRKFRKIQTKQDTFAVSLQNFLLLMVPLVAFVFLSHFI